MRIVAVGDLHCRDHPTEELRTLLKGIGDGADVLVLAGDLTETGLPHEMEVLLGMLKKVNVPKIAVLGNHDYESDQQDTLTQMLCDADVRVLNGTVCEMDGVGFVGTKGFCGGFDNLFIQPFGERALKTFIQTSIEEAVQLENALAKLDCPRKVAILHYAPIKATVEGEPPELHAFLGCSRLANALDRQGVAAILHGHAHYGSPEGRTPGGIPVYNVCRFVQARHGPHPYCRLEV
ncbi:MAG: metallophosphoesterase [Anaerolineae bacterium]|nr:metallophosphoesterase [Anaerolineae bacterium]